LLLVREDAGEIRRLRLVEQRLLTATEDGLAPAPKGVAGVCLLGPGMLRRVADLEPEPTARTLDFATLAERLARDGGRVHMRAVHDWRQFAGDALDLLDMNRTMLDAMDFDSTPPPAGNGNRFEGPIAIHPSASVSSSVIIGPVIVGADALIADSYIGPHTSIAERVRIEGAELERSIVLADASVLHVGGRLVASVVGREARVFRDFSVPRALRLQVGDGDEVALC
jgi:glucose-1-phosphate thymidylyltransferase